MRRVANATLRLRFDRYDEPPDSRTETPDPSTGIRPRTRVSGRNAGVWALCEACPHHVVVGQSPD
jgi:hypothetical protein